MLTTAWALLGSGCTSVPVTPAALRAAAPSDAGSSNALVRWQQAVGYCNEFLSSTNRKTLPEGTVKLTDYGMEFVTSNRVQPARIRCTSWGDVLVRFGFSAQERSDGFVVGSEPPGKSRLTDNSFFRNGDGSVMSSPGMAELALHEMTHTYYHCGTVSFGKGVMYYLEAVFLFHYRNHSMERLPFQTSREFAEFYRSKVMSYLKEHPEVMERLRRGRYAPL